jgi:protein SCO1/2
VLWVLGGAGEAAQFRGALVSPPRALPELTLSTHDGEEFRLSRERGRVAAMAFGYTFCPDVCPATLAAMAQVHERLGTEAGRLRVYFVTVDPERDTPARLRQYVGHFSRAFVGLTGTPERLAEARRAFGVVAEKRQVQGTAAAYLVDHSASVYVVDPDGRLRLLFPFGMAVEDMAQDIRTLLSQHPPAASSPVLAQAVTIRVAGAWARRAPGGAAARGHGKAPGPSGTPGGPANGAVYLRLINAGTEDDALVAASSPVAETVELHEVRHEGGVMKMRPVPRIAVPAGAEVELKPGGYHVMLLGLRRALEPGDTVPVRLRFSRGAELDVDAPVR